MNVLRQSGWIVKKEGGNRLARHDDGDGPHIADLPKARVQRQKAAIDESQLADLPHPGSSQELPAVEELELEAASSAEEDSAGSSKEQSAKASVPDN